MTPCSNCREPSNHLMEVGDEHFCLVCVMDRSTSCSECLRLVDRYSPQVYEITNKGDSYFVESACLVKCRSPSRLHSSVLTAPPPPLPPKGPKTIVFQ